MPSQQLLAEMGKFNEELVKAGVLLAGEGLHPSSRGKRVRFSGVKRTVIDGPFVETKELVGGFFLIEADSKDESLEWARRMPLEEGEVEVRPLFQLPEFPDASAGKGDGGRPEDLRSRVGGVGDPRPARKQQLRTTPLPRKPGTIRFIALVKADKATEWKNKLGLPDLPAEVFALP